MAGDKSSARGRVIDRDNERDALRYFESNLHGNWDGWRLVLAVFLVACTVTTVVFVIVALCAFVPLLRIFPRLADASIQTFFLLGIGASLLVLGISWVVQASFGILTDGDYFLRGWPSFLMDLWRC